MIKHQITVYSFAMWYIYIYLIIKYCIPISKIKFAVYSKD